MHVVLYSHFPPVFLLRSVDIFAGLFISCLENDFIILSVSRPIVMRVKGEGARGGEEGGGKHWCIVSDARIPGVQLLFVDASEDPTGSVCFFFMPIYLPMNFHQ